MASTRMIQKLPPGAALARLAKTFANARGGPAERTRFAEEYFTSSPEVAAYLHTKAGVPAASLGNATWIGEQHPMADEILLLRRDYSAFDALLPFMREIPFLLQVPRDASANTIGGVVAEGAAAPVGRLTTDHVILEAQKIVAATILTKEILRLNRRTDAFIAATLLANLGNAQDAAFLDPSRSTSITFGVTPVLSTGSTTAAIQADLGSLLAAVTTKLTRGVWIMRRRTMSHIALMLGAAASDLPRTLLGMPVIATSSTPAINTSPGEHVVVLADAAEIVFADDGYELDASDQATAEMDSAPSSTGISPTGAAQVSFFQAGLVGLLQTRRANWSARSGSVSFMGVTY